MTILEAIFWASATAVAYHYLVYPAALIALSRLRAPVSPTDPQEWPTVSVVIAAYNEERVIDWKIRDTLALDYEHGRLQVIVACDGSDDRTADIARSFADQSVICLHLPRRGGKTAALNRALPYATGEIVVFSDANNEFSRDAIRMLVRHFQDPSVGGVCGAKHIKPEAGRESSMGDGLYWRYESAVKAAESRLGTICNADGEIFAIRRALYRPVPEHIINDDAEITLALIEQHTRILYEPEARSFELASRRIAEDFQVKVRMVAGGYQTIAEHAGELFPLRSWFNWSFFSHKTLRWLAPVFLLIMLASSAALAGIELYRWLLAAQLLFYAVALAGALLVSRMELPALVYVPFYFTAMNLAAFQGLVRFLRRRQSVQWRKAQR